MNKFIDIVKDLANRLNPANDKRNWIVIGIVAALALLCFFSCVAG